MEEIKYITVDDLTDDYIEKMETNYGSGSGYDNGSGYGSGTGYGSGSGYGTGYGE